MYDYRKMSPDQRKAAVQERLRRGFPWHRPPHPEAPGEYRIVTAACFEHRKILDSAERLAWFENELLEKLRGLELPCACWCVLPNHYHVLVQIGDMKEFAGELGKLHGRTSFEINRQDNTRGRRVWYRCADRVMRSERHFFATLNYIHNNPVKHGYVTKWQEWPFSSVPWYLQEKGRGWLLEVWREYPLLDYGDKWDRF